MIFANGYKRLYLRIIQKSKSAKECKINNHGDFALLHLRSVEPVTIFECQLDMAISEF